MRFLTLVLDTLCPIRKRARELEEKVALLSEAGVDALFALRNLTLYDYEQVEPGHWAEIPVSNREYTKPLETALVKAGAVRLQEELPPFLASYDPFEGEDPDIEFVRQKDIEQFDAGIPETGDWLDQVALSNLGVI